MDFLLRHNGATKAFVRSSRARFRGSIIFLEESRMSKMSNVRRLVFAALCLALSVVLPFAFHAVANAGSIFLPMHLPVLLCGIICGWPYGLACGALAPILSNLVTGGMMPPMAYVPAMTCELAVYGLVAGLIMKYLRTGKTVADVLISLVAAMLAGRAAMGALNALIFRAGAYSFAVWFTSLFATALPGIVIQIALIPILIFALERAKVLPRRYPAQA